MFHVRQARLLILAALQPMAAAWALRRVGTRAAAAVQPKRALGRGLRAFRSTVVSMRAEPPLPRLDLVFDINKTIVLEDPAGGKDVRALLNEFISELAWGRVLDDGDGGDQAWTSAALPLSIDPPLLEKQPQQQQPLVSYSSFVHKQHPDIAGGDLKAAKATRDGLKGTFAEPGAPGQAYAHEVAALDAALRLPDPGNLDLRLMDAAGLTGRDRVLLLPAFIHFLLRLQADYPAGRFALQFRTFGDDLPRVAREFNALCAGQHPLFPGQRLGSDGVGGPLVDHSLDLEKDAECFGSMYRDAQGPVLVLGTFDGPSSRADLARYQERGHRVLGSVEEIHAFVRQKQASTRSTLAIRDYWPWWRENLEDGSAGKLVMVDDEALTIVVDDNIEKKRSHIVDLRFARTGSPVPFAEGVARGHLVRAEPFLALTQPQTYFWSSVLQSVAKWNATTGNSGAKGRGGAGPPPAAGG